VDAGVIKGNEKKELAWRRCEQLFGGGLRAHGKARGVEHAQRVAIRATDGGGGAQQGTGALALDADEPTVDGAAAAGAGHGRVLLDGQFRI